MLKRVLLWVVVLAAIAVAIYLLWQSRQKSTVVSPETNLPLELQRVVPAQWKVNWLKQCDLDADGDQEWLITYDYNPTSITPPYQPQAAKVARGPIGGVVYDAQVSPPADAPSNQSPYRSTSLFPYRLLPDFYQGKGQGYLGESSVDVILYPASTSQDQKCQAEEITVVGYSDGKLPTRLSVFRWQDTKVGYQGAHFVGDARIATPAEIDSTQPISEVTTYNRLRNHRSLLCEVRRYVRQAGFAAPVFTEDLAAFTIDFCFKTPDEPVYPEGVVVAVLRGASPPQPAAQTPTPLPFDSSYLLSNARMDPTLDLSGNIRILSVTNAAAVNRDATGGDQCTTGEIQTNAEQWWCGRETAQIATEIIVSGQVRQADWLLISITPNEVNADVRWRVAEVVLQ